MDVPVYACAACEVLVSMGEEVGAYEGRDDGLDGLVEERCEEDFVDVVGKGGELEACYVGVGEGEEVGGW